jgi:hypothetical protein
MATSIMKTIIPIYTSRGDAEAFLAYPYLYNYAGEWIGWVTPKREVYSVLGYYVGELTNEPRIVRRVSVTSDDRPHLSPPPRPPRIQSPGSNRLPPMMGDLQFGHIDVLLDEPDKLHTVDTGEMQQDMD